MEIDKIKILNNRYLESLYQTLLLYINKDVLNKCKWIFEIYSKKITAMKYVLICEDEELNKVYIGTLYPNLKNNNWHIEGVTIMDKGRFELKKMIEELEKSTLDKIVETDQEFYL